MDRDAGPALSRRESLGLMLALGAGSLAACAGGTEARAQDGRGGARRPAAGGDREGSVRDALARSLASMAALGRRGGYVYSYGEDGTRYAGDRRWPIGARDHLVERPGTPHVGATFLRAHLEDIPGPNLERAVGAGLALASTQGVSGGWERTATVPETLADRPGFARRATPIVLDDNVSAGASHFLLSLRGVEGAGPWLDEAAALSLDGLIASQGPNGGWPLEVPTPPSRTYSRFEAFNDGTTNGCIDTLLRAHRLTGRDDCRDAVDRAVRFILRTQLGAPTPGWAQQYGQDAEPVGARRHEPEAACAPVTGRNIQTLLDVYAKTGERTLLAPAERAAAWLERARLESGEWARFYDLRTGRPLYVDREGGRHDAKARGLEGYLWEHTFGIPSVLERVGRLRERGADDFQRSERLSWDEAFRVRFRDRLWAQASRAMEAMDDDGLWRSGEAVNGALFVANTDRMLRFLELRRPGGEGRRELRVS